MTKRVIGTRFQGGTYDIFVNPSYSVDVYACQYDRTKTSGTINYLDGDVRDVTTCSDADAIHKSVSSEISSITEKTAPVDNDITIIEDSAASYAKKKLTWSNIKTALKSYFDGLYATLSHTHTNMITGSGTANTIPKFTGANTIGNSSIIDGTNLTFSKNVDFAKYKAIAMACDNGSTLPTSPATGQWFLHTPTGRKVLMMYDGSNWQPIISFGNMTLYVNGASGSDSPDKGWGSGANAFATPDYAVSMIPVQYGGNVVIWVASGTYSSLTLRGKYPTGNYGITINGTMQTDYSGTVSSGTTGSAENYATLTVSGASWTPNQWVGYLAYYNSDYRVIYSNTADTITVVGYYSSTPATTLQIQHSTTTISNVYVYCNNVSLYYLDLYYVYAKGITDLFLYRNKITNQTIYSPSAVNSLINMNTCYIRIINSYGYSTIISQGSKLSDMRGCFWNSEAGSATAIAVRVDSTSICGTGGGVFAINGYGTGVYLYGDSYMTCWSAGGKLRITNCGTGYNVSKGSQVELGASNNYFSGCTTNYTADATTYGYYS